MGHQMQWHQCNMKLKRLDSNAMGIRASQKATIWEKIILWHDGAMVSNFFKCFVFPLGCNHGTSCGQVILLSRSNTTPFVAISYYVPMVKVEKPLEYLRLEFVLASVGTNISVPGIINTQFLKSIFSLRFFK